MRVFINSCFLIAASFFCLPTLKGQSIELLGESGPIIQSIHPSSNRLLDQSNYMAASLRFAWHGDTNKLYSKIYDRPFYGIGVYSGTFNNQFIGDPVALYFYIKTPLIRKISWNAFYEIGAGIAGNLNPYHRDLNPNNELIGSPVNMLGHLAVGFEYKLSKQFTLGASIGYKHFSNGYIKAPNLGINVIPISLNGSYNLSKNRSHYLKEKNQSFLPHNRISIFYAPGSKNFGAGEKNYFVSTFGLLFIRQTNYKTGFGAGVDLFYKSSGTHKVQNEKNDLSKTLSSGIYASFEWVFTEKFRLNTGAGLYIMRNPENDEPYPFYERISARYTITHNLLAGVGVKINGHSSDYIEWTLGYTFNKDKNLYK